MINSNSFFSYIYQYKDHLGRAERKEIVLWTILVNEPACRVGKSLSRTGGYDSAVTLIGIDNLSYFYDATHKNQLIKVVDLSNSSQGFNDDATGTIASDVSDDYAYDAYGNMIKDENKGITSITYNHLNLPKHISFNMGNIHYTYDATGVKLKKEVIETTMTYTESSTTAYLGGYQYTSKAGGSASESDGSVSEAELQFFPTAEGYVAYNEIDNIPYYNYVYQYKDHLGRAERKEIVLWTILVNEPACRVALNYSYDTTTSSLKILEENNYYPFGLKHGAYNKIKIKPSPIAIEDQVTATSRIMAFIQVANAGYQYKYQGQERQDELDLNWDSFKWRNYDYAIGRFMSVDPLAEKYPYNSTYAFQENKMGLGRELEGLELERERGMWMASNPLGAIAEGFRQMFDGVASLFNVKAGVKYTNYTRVSDGNTGKSSVSVSNDKVVKTDVTLDGSKLFDYSGQNEVDLTQKADEAVTVETTTSFETTVKAEGTFTVEGVPINVSNTTKVDSSGKKTTQTEINTGTSGTNVYVNTTTTTNSDGTTSNSEAAGTRVTVPVTTDQDPNTNENVKAYIEIQR